MTVVAHTASFKSKCLLPLAPTSTLPALFTRGVTTTADNRKKSPSTTTTTLKHKTPIDPRLQKALREALFDDSSRFIQATLHNPIIPQEPQEQAQQGTVVTRATIRPILIKHKLHYQITTIVNRQAFDENWLFGTEELENRILSLVSQFHQSVIHTISADIHIHNKLVTKSPPVVKQAMVGNSDNDDDTTGEFNSIKKPTVMMKTVISSKKATKTASLPSNNVTIVGSSDGGGSTADQSSKMPTTKTTTTTTALSHNRTKSYILQEGSPIDFLVELGVMNEQGKVLARKYDKFRQINKFLELVQDVIPGAGIRTKQGDDSSQTQQEREPLRIIDFGCGKSYLTFALYHYLTTVLNVSSVQIVGLDLKEQVIQDCNALAKKLNYENLRFERGDIKDFSIGSGDPNGSKVDMVITLHACNTATDQAICKAVSWNCETILSVPCCHQELYPQIESEPLYALLKHGILKERVSSLVTDALRAQILEILGYKAQIVEFIDLEHTAKNLLIRAEKRKQSLSQAEVRKKASEYLALRNAMNADPCLERLLRSRLEPYLALVEDPASQ